jgi:hypothetical protein
MKEILFELFHYLIGLIIVSFLLWIIIVVHNYFSKDNFPIDQLNEAT